MGIPPSSNTTPVDNTPPSAYPLCLGNARRSGGTAVMEVCALDDTQFYTWSICLYLMSQICRYGGALSTATEVLSPTTSVVSHSMSQISQPSQFMSHSDLLAKKRKKSSRFLSGLFGGAGGKRPPPTRTDVHHKYRSLEGMMKEFERHARLVAVRKIRRQLCTRSDGVLVGRDRIRSKWVWALKCAGAERRRWPAATHQSMTDVSL
eukprot:GHVO01005944.1.p1 GENE.GHVO01005944.1~~GHVO01005944.1.p1  ORF type:complete len:206 (+),score=57.74 GHVO01005944.1:2-619(+)